MSTLCERAIVPMQLQYEGPATGRGPLQLAHSRTPTAPCQTPASGE